MKGGEGGKGQRIADSEIFHSSLGFLRDHLSHVALDARAEPFPPCEWPLLQLEAHD